MRVNASTLTTDSRALTGGREQRQRHQDAARSVTCPDEGCGGGGSMLQENQWSVCAERTKTCLVATSVSTANTANQAPVAGTKHLSSGPLGGWCSTRYTAFECSSDARWVAVDHG